MPGPGRVAHEVAIAGRLAWRALLRHRHKGSSVDDTAFRARLAAWLAGIGPDLLASHAFHYLPATAAPWFDTGMDLDAGDPVTLLADGRVYVSRLLDIWVPPSFQLWCRVGDTGPIFRGTRNTQGFIAGHGGRLWLANCFPGEWADDTGRLKTPASEYAKASGGTSVLVLRWRPGVDPAVVLKERASDPQCPGLALAEAQRSNAPAVAAPAGWDYLWFLGPAEIYRASHTKDGHPAICCHTQGDTGILRREVRAPLAPGARLRWSWRVDELPMDLAEDTLPSHDYMSIAAEFDDGQDITYYWSAALPVDTAYRCPLPTWKDRETHVVVRSGPTDLGRWLTEERDLHADYARLIGGKARGIVRVWLIANSLLARGRGRCEYARIEIESGSEKIEVL